MDAMLALLPEDEVPGSLFLELFMECLPIEMRDHLVTNEFKNPTEMALHADRLWDARKAQNRDSSVAVLTPTTPTRVHGRDGSSYSPSRGHSSPNRRSQTPGARGHAGSKECYFHKKFGSSADNCKPPCSFQGNFRADGRRRN